MKRLVLPFFIIFLLSLSPFLWCQNLLQNPGFESWLDDSTCEFWYRETTGFSTAKESGTVHSGTYSAKLILSSTATQRLVQYVAPINSGNDYGFSFWCFDNDPYGRARVAIRWYDGTGSFISGYYGDYSSDSTEWQELTSGPRAAPASAETAHVEVRLYDVSGFTDTAIVYVDDACFADSGSGTPPETLTIYQIQGQALSSPYEDSSVVTYGIVTGVFSSDFFIEEQPGGAWHGIYVYGSATTPARGDSVRVTGIITEHFGMTEITGPIVDVLTGGVTLPAPTILPTGSVSVEDYESVLMRVNSATCTDDSLGHGEWEIDDGSGPLIVDDMGVSYKPTIGESYTVIGPLNYNFGDFMMEPRDSSDIIAGGGVSEVPESKNVFSFTVFPTVSKTSININLSINRANNAEVSIYSISGRKIATLLSKNLTKGKHTIVWSGKSVSAGIYFVKVNMEGETEIRKVSILR